MSASEQPSSKCPKCGFDAGSGFSECPRCGVIVEKFLRGQRLRGERAHGGAPTGADHDGVVPVAQDTETPDASRPDRFKDLLFTVSPDMSLFHFVGRVVLFVMLLAWGWKFFFAALSSDFLGRSFLHLVNLPFHEAGHVIFRPLGRFVSSLGGTLGQLLIPLLCMAVFLVKTRDAFAASACLWWLAINFIDIAPYINDARAGVLPLLGGNIGQTSPYGFHDWEFILTETGLLRYDHTVAMASQTAGRLILLVSIGWAGYLLWKQYGNLER